MTNTSTTVTNKQIEALATEAGAHGDTEQVRLCELALEGDTEARNECARVIESARAARACTDGVSRKNILTSLDFASVNAALAPDARRMMAAEAQTIRATQQAGGDVAAAVAEAKRVAEMWGVTL